MEETLPNQWSPLEYDEERLRMFCTRATHGTNLSRAYRPDFDEVEQAIFADTIIGGYVDLSNEQHEGGGARHTASLGRVAFAISFLEGEPLDHLNESIQDNVAAKKKGVREFALGVAGEGARYIQKSIIGDVPPKEIKTRQTESYHSIEEFIDLTDSIKTLFADGHISSGKAQALLLLLGQADSVAHPMRQQKAVEAICRDLKPRLKIAIIHQPHAGEKLIDQTFAKGSSYLKAIISTPFSVFNGNKTFEMLVDLESGDDGDPAHRSLHRDQVHGHLGYVINTLYRIE